jgi:hypothetical protein
MKLTKEQINFLNEVCEDSEWMLNSEGEVDVDGYVYMDFMELTEIPVKFGRVNGYFSCSGNKLTTLKNCPKRMVGYDPVLYCDHNNLTEYFKNIKDRDFPHWDKLLWFEFLPEYPFLINIMKKYLDNDDLKKCLNSIPETKIYYKD